MAENPSFLAQLRDGAPSAYAVLVERYEGPLYRFFFLDHRDHHTAQEETAETFAQLVRSLPGIRGGCETLGAYVFATARHVQLRRVRKRKTQPIRLDEATAFSDPRPSPETLASDREELQRVLDAISGFEESMRNVLLLRFVEGLSIEEVSAALGMPIGTVKSQIHRSRIQLRQMFSDKEQGL